MEWLLGVACALLGLATIALSVAVARLRGRLSETETDLRMEIESSSERLLRLESVGARSVSESSALLQASGEAILILDSTQNILRANQVAHSIFRVQSGGLPGRTLIQATLSTELSDMAAAALGGSPVEKRVVRLPGASGATLIVTALPVQTDAAVFECLIAARDVTDVRRLEAVRRDFVGNVSHELRTPLASIRAMAETLQDGAHKDPEVAGRFLDTIIRESDRLTRIAQDLLVLTAAESGTLEQDEVDLSALLRNIGQHLQPQAEKGELSLVVHVEAGLMVAGSSDQFQQVFLNLVDNAIKYTRPGGSVTLSACARDSMVVAQVKDNGIGIMSEHLPRIFERFYRVDKGRSRASGGTGLGLSIVKHIVESHGGSVMVESEFNQGSIFTVTLPAYSDPLPAPTGQASTP